MVKAVIEYSNGQTEVIERSSRHDIQMFVYMEGDHVQSWSYVD